MPARIMDSMSAKTIIRGTRTFGPTTSSERSDADRLTIRSEASTRGRLREGRVLPHVQDTQLGCVKAPGGDRRDDTSLEERGGIIRTLPQG